MTEEKAKFQLATVEAVEAEGLKLKLDGEEAAGEKLYKCAADVLFKVGDRVKITEDSGTYMADFVLGAPMERLIIPHGGQDGQILAKDGSDDYTLKWVDASGGNAESNSLVYYSSKVTLSNEGLLPNATNIHLGSSRYPFGNLYAQGDALFGRQYYNTKLGFFGSVGATKQTVANTATVGTLITALKAYGLIG